MLFTHSYAYIMVLYSSGFIPVTDAVSIFNLIDDLFGGSRFWSEEVELRVEDAILEIQDIMNTLEE